MTYLYDALKANGARLLANDNIANELAKTDHKLQDQMEADVRMAIAGLLRALCIDTEDDHNTNETAGRVARMYVRELMRGRFERMPDVTAFPNALKLDELYVTGPLSIRSMCSHHLCPIMGRAWIGIVPGEDSVIGLSKFNRLADWVFARPQIQEEASIQLADLLEQQTKPRGLAVLVKANHFCMTWRGVKESSDAQMTTSVMRGVMRTDPAARQEFFSIVNGA